MAITLNGVEITSNKLNSSDVTLETLNGVKVWPPVGHKWVYISVWTSDPGYTPFYEITSLAEEATAELMEQRFPANNYDLGKFGAIQWYENFYIFQVQGV